MEEQILHEKLQAIELLVMDVDGTLTDGAMYFSAAGEELKRFSTRDGMGINLLQLAGIDTAIMTSESSLIVTARAKKLKIKHVVLGSKNKYRALMELADQLGLPLKKIAYIGDDVNDIPPFKLAGVKACPADSVPQIKELADYICIATGGNGAVREFADMILNAQNKPLTVPEDNW